MDSFYIAWKYIRFNTIKTAIVVACVTLIAFLPIALHLLLGESERLLLSRAGSTPLIVGAKGSALDLVMNSLYFGAEIPETMTMAAVMQIQDSDMAFAIPLYVRYQARGYPIVGTSLDYFDFRNLQPATGRLLAVLGECVLGATTAKALGLAPGDDLLSAAEHLFDLAGVYPLKMKVVGVLEPAYTADDLAVFVDLKTAWIIEGLSHGHEDLAATKDPSLIIERSDDNITANAKVFEFTEINQQNLESFHAHGDPSSYPITAAITVPEDDKAATILRGRYLENTAYQLIHPRTVIEGLLDEIFRIKNLIDAVLLVVGAATLATVALVFGLSLRLRRGEIETIFKIGCSRMTMARLLAAEIFVMLAVSGFFCAVFALVLRHYSQELVRMLLIQ
ncbi:MAG: ABC transporter permease [Gammaproteobacteria bacterium]|nr:ABC transporter permease [Gammaproteobacteria bacterium]